MLASSWCGAYGLTPETLPAVVGAIRDFRPDAIEGWPSAITVLASLLRDQGLTLPVRAVITSSEVTTATQADLMRSVFQGPIVDHYGQTERVAMAGSCEAGGYHVFPDYGIVELAARDRDQRQLGDRRDVPEQLGIPPVPVPHRRPCQARRPRPVPVRPRLSAPGAHRRKSRGLLHQRRWPAPPIALDSDRPTSSACARPR